MDLSGIEAALREDTEASVFFPDGFRAAVQEVMTGGGNLSERLAERFMETVRETTGEMKRFFLTLFSCVLFCAIAGQGSDAVSDPAMRGAVEFAASSVMLVPILSALLSCVRLASGVLRRTGAWMNVLLSVMLTVLSSVGASASVNALNPAGLLMNALVEQLAAKVLFPMVLFMGALSGVDALSPTPRFRGITELFRRSVTWGLGVGMTVFSGVMALRNFNGVSYDALGIRTMKYTLSAVPVVGSAVSDSMDLLIHCLLLVKNGVGTAGMAAALLIAGTPLIRITAQMWSIRLCAALTEMFAPGRTAGALKELAGLFGSVLSILVTVLFLFFLTVTLGICAGRGALWG